MIKGRVEWKYYIRCDHCGTTGLACPKIEDGTVDTGPAREAGWQVVIAMVGDELKPIDLCPECYEAW